MRHLDEGRLEMEKIRRLGVDMSIDDFGTGYSSLHRLQGLPVETIKIDQSFVQELEGGSRSSVSVIQAIITLAHDLNLTVVAEGVETRKQMEILKSLRCDVFQGYLLHRPLLAENVRDLLADGGEEAEEVVLPSHGAGI
jgi:EAL domain-containing protein (putative c-di-GMP-specific phosphodiesterase class I)